MAKYYLKGEKTSNGAYASVRTQFKVWDWAQNGLDYSDRLHPPQARCNMCLPRAPPFTQSLRLLSRPKVRQTLCQPWTHKLFCRRWWFRCGYYLLTSLWVVGFSLDSSHIQATLNYFVDRVRLRKLGMPLEQQVQYDTWMRLQSGMTSLHVPSVLGSLHQKAWAVASGSSTAV